MRARNSQDDRTLLSFACAHVGYTGHVADATGHQTEGSIQNPAKTDGT